VAGIGDDCAVLAIPARHQLLVTTDFTLEGVHFRREWHPPAVVGRRCLTRGLSDIAAMGGDPIAAFLSLAFPRTLPQAWVEGFLQGLLQLADEFRVTLAGGDTAESPDGVLADIMVVGSVPIGEAILRSGARPGDGIYVTGELGGSSAALEELSAQRRIRPLHYPHLFRPVPRVVVGRVLRQRSLASAMIDLSDGLSTDLAHICEASGVGARVLAASIPRAVVGSPGIRVDLREALHGGEDYELLFTAPRAKRIPMRIAGIPVSQIGQIIRGKRVVLIGENGAETRLLPQGWQHFRG
jgi:thiamine-monophosphate kinase